MSAAPPDRACGRRHVAPRGAPALQACPVGRAAAPPRVGAAAARAQATPDPRALTCLPALPDSPQVHEGARRLPGLVGHGQQPGPGQAQPGAGVPAPARRAVSQQTSQLPRGSTAGSHGAAAGSGAAPRQQAAYARARPAHAAAGIQGRCAPLQLPRQLPSIPRHASAAGHPAVQPAAEQSAACSLAGRGLTPRF